jgi:hypothetical protein
VRVGEGWDGGKGAVRGGVLPGTESSSIVSLKDEMGVTGLCWIRRRCVVWDETVPSLRR